MLHDLLRRRADEAGRAWLDKALATVSGAASAEQVLSCYAGASRRLGKQALALDETERAQVRAVDAELALERWGCDEAGRALLLLSLPQDPAEAYGERVLLCYEKGDSREQESWLRGLAVLPQPQRWLLTAVDACRTNIVPLFESIACENPYPARHFAELNFNQMVLKALFNGVALERMVGLARRANPELSRMADGYASEREAAGRSVPQDIWSALVPHATPERLQRAYRYLEHEDARHRYWVAQALATVPGEQTHARLAARAARETDARVRDVLRRAN